jgi:tetratricopeptide (TPR) repeat protein
MPRQATDDIAHEQVTDHHIQRIPGVAIENDTLKSHELTTVGNLPGESRAYGLAYAQMALHGDHFAMEQGLKFLREAEVSNEKTADPDLHTQLGFLEQTNGEKADAVREYQAALKDDPLNSAAAGNLAILQAQAGDTTDAVHLWESVVTHDPAQLAAGYDLAVTQCVQGDAVGAQQTLNRLLIFSPDNGPARQLSLAIASGTHRCGGTR